MIRRPVILRARIAFALAAKYPGGMSSCQLQQVALPGLAKGPEMREVLEEMVGDGLLARGEEPSRCGRPPVPIYLAGRSLVGR